MIVDPTKITIKIRNKYTNKAMSARMLSSFYNISLTNTMMFGNDINDIEVVRAVGKGIAVADSDTYLKTIAYDVISLKKNRINSDGVADYLKKYFNF